ncbi:MAG: L-threonylcarbamoyladenylate synthase [Phycisphaerales bacterium]
MIAGPEDIAEAVDRLKRGQLVAFPTETVYGLGADALNAQAVRRVFEVKGRPANNPLIVHVSDPDMARPLVVNWPRQAEDLARAFWPGPLSILLPKAARVPSEVTAGGPEVALRCPDHPTALALIEAFGGPLVGPSANLSGHVSPTTASHVRESFSAEDVFVLDGGACTRGIESTVVALGGTPRVLRPGIISAGQIGEVLGCDVAPYAPVAPDGEAFARAPGQQTTHYAPRCPAWIVTPETIEPAARELSPAVLLAILDTRERPGVKVIRLPGEDLTYAAGLYRALREADAMSPRAILIEAPPGDTDIWRAIWDRLTRAARRFGG